MTTLLRKRNQEGCSNIQMCLNDDRPRRTLHNKRLDASVIFATLVTVYIIVYIIILVRLAQFPAVDSNHVGASGFSETRARRYLQEIVSFGPRVSGSNSNKAAADYVLDEINKIKASANNIYTLETDVQTVSGSFSISDFDFTSAYQNQKNVIVRIGPDNLEHSLLINCHYDTVVDSPGAGDDGAACAVMLEVLRALSKQNKPLPHSIIFMFNGAEENILQASHGFITQHKWAKSIKTFINMEGAGAGGREMLFQTGPNHLWLIETYMAAVPYPFASIMGQEIFQADLVPSDTDFRIFRDFGNIPGLDFVYMGNGYVYHTRNDLPRFVEPGCLQHTGENILALARALVNSPYFVNPGDHHYGSCVYFDFLGLFMVSYTQRFAVGLNSAVVVAVLALVVIKAVNNSRKKKTWLLYFAAVMGGLVVTMVTLFAVAIVMGFFMGLVGREMSYYTYHFNMFVVFVTPAVAVTLYLHHYMKQKLFKGWLEREIAVMYFECSLLLWSLVVAILTFKGILSTYIPLMFVICPLLTHGAVSFASLRVEKNTNIKVYCAVTIFGTLVPQMYIIYVMKLLTTFFIPIMGLSQMKPSADVVMAGMTMVPVAMVLSFQIGLMYFGHRIDRVAKWLLAMAFVGILVVIFSPLGFPFASGGQLSKQRVFVFHLDPQFHSSSGTTTKKDASVWVLTEDAIGLELIEQEAPALFQTAQSVNCDDAYCDRVFFKPCINPLKVRNSYGVDLPATHLSLPRVNLNVSRVQESDSVHLLKVNLTGPAHVTIMVCPWNGVLLNRWSFGGPEQNYKPSGRKLIGTERTLHSIYYTYGEKPEEPWSFTAEFSVPPGYKNTTPLADMAVSGHYRFGDNQYSSAMTDFMEKLPDWTTVSGWTVMLDVFQF